MHPSRIRVVVDSSSTADWPAMSFSEVFFIAMGKFWVSNNPSDTYHYDFIPILSDPILDSSIEAKEARNTYKRPDLSTGRL